MAAKIGHFLHNKRSGRDGFFSLKLDLSQAYDRVEWRFLKVMIEKLGFASEWIKMVMAYVTFVPVGKARVEGQSPSLVFDCINLQGKVVGDGRWIRVWMDRWLPWPSTFKVLLALPSEQVHMKVEELIDTSTRVWRTDLFFSPKEISLILSLPLSFCALKDRLVWHYDEWELFSVNNGFCAPKDRLVWHYDEWGLFSVNNRYWVAQQWLQYVDSSASSSSNASAYVRLWKHLWKTNIPPKVKKFTWRVCHKILPTKVNLKKKGVGVEPEWDLSGRG
ncbi:hypothetical protein ACFX2I_022487 [Malus domestica]